MIFTDGIKREITPMPDSIPSLLKKNTKSKRSFIRKAFLGFLVLWVFPTLPNEKEDLSRIESIESVVSQGNRYKLFPIELFDGESVWRISKGASFLDSTSFVSKSPSTDAFKKESKLYYKEETKVKSIQVHSNVEIPGRDKYFLKPELPKPLPAGNPSRVFFWVYSNNYDINLKLIFSQKKSQDVVVDFGLLKFNGWRRMDAKVTSYKPQERLNYARSGRFELKGILLESSSKQEKGSFFLFIDQMGVLIEKPETYPGSEVPDGWELY
jgi:hypothetical protein